MSSLKIEGLTHSFEEIFYKEWAQKVINMKKETRTVVYDDELRIEAYRFEGIIQPLCDVLGISLNEFFSGEHISAEEYKAISNYYVLTPFKRKEDLYANVYIDKDNPAKYSVELFQTGR